VQKENFGAGLSEAMFPKTKRERDFPGRRPKAGGLTIKHIGIELRKKVARVRELEVPSVAKKKKGV